MNADQAERLARDRPRRLARYAQWYETQGEIEKARHARAELHRSGCCMLCGRRLTDPVSVERGIGPDCFAAARGPNDDGSVA